MAVAVSCAFRFFDATDIMLHSFFANVLTANGGNGIRNGNDDEQCGEALRSCPTVFEVVAAGFEILERGFDAEATVIMKQHLVCILQVGEQIPNVRRRLTICPFLMQDEIVFAETTFLGDLNVQILLGHTGSLWQVVETGERHAVSGLNGRAFR